MLTFLKAYFNNLRHIPSTASAIMAVIAYLLNKSANVIPPEIANQIMVILGPLVLLFFVGDTKKE